MWRVVARMRYIVGVGHVEGGRDSQRLVHSLEGIEVLRRLEESTLGDRAALPIPIERDAALYPGASPRGTSSPRSSLPFPFVEVKRLVQSWADLVSEQLGARRQDSRRLVATQSSFPRGIFTLHTALAVGLRAKLGQSDLKAKGEESDAMPLREGLDYVAMTHPACR